MTTWLINDDFYYHNTSAEGTNKAFLFDRLGMRLGCSPTKVGATRHLEGCCEDLFVVYVKL